MITLLIETSTERGIVAIMDGEQPLFHVDLPYGYQNSKYLLPAIYEGFKKVGMTIQDCMAITVGIGPGSYTGIRVGAMVAKTLAYACSLPLIGIGTLEGFVPSGETSFAVMIDAKISGAYLLKGCRVNGVIKYNSSTLVCPLDNVHEHLEDVDLVLSPNCSRIKDALQKQNLNRVLEWQEIAPCPIQMTRLALQKYRSENYSKDANLELVYLRHPLS